MSNKNLDITIVSVIVLIVFTYLYFYLRVKPEFYIDGKPYYTVRRCVKDTVYSEFGLNYSYSYNSNYQYQYGNKLKTKCIKTKIDTIEIK